MITVNVLLMGGMIIEGKSFQVLYTIWNPLYPKFYEIGIISIILSLCWTLSQYKMSGNARTLSQSGWPSEIIVLSIYLISCTALAILLSAWNFTIKSSRNYFVTLVEPNTLKIKFLDQPNPKTKNLIQLPPLKFLRSTPFNISEFPVSEPPVSGPPVSESPVSESPASKSIVHPTIDWPSELSVQWKGESICIQELSRCVPTSLSPPTSLDHLSINIWSWWLSWITLLSIASYAFTRCPHLYCPWISLVATGSGIFLWSLQRISE